MSGDESAPIAKRRRWHEWFDERFRTPAAIYGLIVYSSLLMITVDHEESIGQTILASASTLVVFFVAHVFAHTLSDHGARGLRRSIFSAVQHSAGMLYAAIPPTVAMLLATMWGSNKDDAAEWAIWTTMAVLFFLGYVAYARRGSSRWMRIVGALGTAFLGVFLVILEYAFH